MTARQSLVHPGPIVRSLPFSIPVQLFPTDDEPSATGSHSWVRVVLFVGSAALAAAALHFTWKQPIVGVVLVGLIALYFAFRWQSRVRLRKALRQGDIDTILRRFSRNVHRVPYAETMAPLMSATAFAAYGWVDKAKAALAAAQRGPAWEAALEHRLFIGTLLAIFEGEREASLEQAEQLQTLPVPRDTPPVLKDRIKLLRRGIAALARAFAHESLPGDRDLLEYASEISPLVFWAMRYGAAIVAIDEGFFDKARELLIGAPRWPDESTFKAFHEEISGKLS